MKTRVQKVKVLGLGALGFSLMALGAFLIWPDSHVTSHATSPVLTVSDDLVYSEEDRPENNTLVGAYLAGRKAAMNGDVFDAAHYYGRAHAVSPDNQSILEQALLYTVMSGEVIESINLAEELRKVDPESRIARIVLMTQAFKKKDYDYALADLGKDERGNSLNAVLGDLLRAWALVGKDKVAEAQAILETDKSQERFFLLRAYHAALIYSMKGEDEKALNLFERLVPENIGEGDLPLRVVLAWGRTLERLGKKEEATKFYEERLLSSSEQAFSSEFNTRITDGVTPDPLVRSVSDGAAETLLGLSRALFDQNSVELSLMYAQLAVYLAPQVDSIQLLIGGLLENLEQFEQAATAYDRVSEESPLYRAAQVGRASSINQKEDNPDLSLKIIQNLSEKFPDDPNVLVAQGDLLRHAEQYEEAAEVYGQAVKAVPEIDETYWALFYTRGMSLERAGEWDLAEKDLKKALELKPEQPLVLNYLGYSWIDRGENLDEALEMVRKAVELRPNDGYIIDSLGWGLYKLGRYEEAVEYLQRAVELRAVDPVITDHYGDALWKSGRKAEARFQWRRALSFETDEDNKLKIKDKLENGLVDS